MKQSGGMERTPPVSVVPDSGCIDVAGSVGATVSEQYVLLTWLQFSLTRRRGRTFYSFSKARSLFFFFQFLMGDKKDLNCFSRLKTYKHLRVELFNLG